MDASTANITCISLSNLLYFVLTFKSDFEEFTFACKSVIFIDDSFIDLGQISLEVYEYKSDLDVALLFHNKTVASSLSGTSLPSAYAYAAFIDSASKNKVIYKHSAR